MLYLFLRIGLILILLLSLMVAVVLATPYDDSQLHSFLTAPENCGGECLLGNRPGVTTVGEAMENLQLHSWIDSTQLSAPGTGYGQIRWRWSGRQPVFIDDNHPGRITFYWDEDEPNAPELNDTPVETISIYTHISMFSLQGWFDRPDSGTAGIRPDGALGYSAAYHRPGVTLILSTTMPCPVTLMSYWNAWTRIAVSIGQGTSKNVSPLEMVNIC